MQKNPNRPPFQMSVAEAINLPCQKSCFPLRFVQKSLNPSLRRTPDQGPRQAPESRIAWKSRIPALASLARNDHFPLLSNVLQDPPSIRKFVRIISNLVGHSDPSPCCPGKKAGAEDKKGRENPSQFPPLCFRKETRGERDTWAETAEARIGKKGITAFFGEANAFLPGHGAIWP